MGFDVQSARKEGYSDREIEDFLSQNHKDFDVHGALKEGYSLDDISQELSAPPIKSPTLASRASEAVKNVTNYPLGLPVNPVSMGKEISKGVAPAYYEMMPRMEKGGAMVKEVAGNILGNIPSNANVGAAVKFGTNLVPFEPSSFMAYLGPLAMKGIQSILPGAEALAPSYGKALMENRVPSTAREIRYAERYGGKTAADLINERPNLGNSRAEILKNSRVGIESLEDKIQLKIKDVSMSKINTDLSATPPKEIDSSVFSKVFDDAIDEASSVPTAGKEVRVLSKLKTEYIKNAPKSGTIDYWMGLKRKLYRRLGDDAYIKDITSAQKNVEKDLASAIAREVEKNIHGIKELNREQGNLIQIRDAIIESSPKEVRDLSLTGPLYERATIMGARTLAKPRKAIGPLPQLPILGAGLND